MNLISPLCVPRNKHCVLQQKHMNLNLQPKYFDWAPDLVSAGSGAPRAPLCTALCAAAASREGEKEIALPLRASEGDTSTTSEGAILSFVVLSKRASDMNKLEDLGG